MTPSTVLTPGITGRRAVYVSAGLICALFGLALQFLIVNLRYGGNWTALFCTGSELPTPPALAAERIYIFPNSSGYDGQAYHYVAHDPLARTDIGRYIDNPRVRYRRILLPALAFLLAFGQQTKIDSAYIAANLLFLFLGGWWLSRYLDLLGMRPQWAMLFALAPASLISLDRLTIDLAFTSLCIGFALYVRLGQGARAYAVLALACLSRDTGLALAAAACLSLAVERRFAKAAALATAAIPTAAWYFYIYLREPDYSDPRLHQLFPFQGIFDAFIHPINYGVAGNIGAGLQWLDRLALLGFLLAAALSIWIARRNGLGQIEAAMLLWSVIGLCLPRSFWEDCYSGARVFTPLLIFVMALGAPLGRWKRMAPLLMVTPRVALQVLGPLFAALASAVRH